jgi:hypothetical protein
MSESQATFRAYKFTVFDSKMMDSPTVSTSSVSRGEEDNGNAKREEDEGVQ